jgi:hypothetical protein
MRDVNKIAEQLFNEIRGRFPKITIGDAEGNITSEPLLARFFDFEFESQGQTLGNVSISLDENDGVTVMYNKDFTENALVNEKEDWYSFLKNLRTFSKKRLLNFEVRDINRSNLTKRDYNQLATTRSGEQQMAESKMYGTHKTSFQKFGSAKLSIKHTGSLEEGENRTKKIGSLFIENAQGEKFKYPFKHLSGARAMARHIGEGGHPFDDFGKHITSLSEELSNLRKFKTYMGRSSVMAESLAQHIDVVNERIISVRKEVANLQKPSYYQTAFEEFVPIEGIEVPENVAGDWIEELTVKQFNEELKDVFPYIYRLVQETTAPTELAFEDIVNEVDKASIDAAVRQAVGGAPASSPRPKLRPQMFASEQEAKMAAIKAGYKEGEFQVKKLSGGKFTYVQTVPDQSNIGSTEIAPNGQVTGSTRGFNTESEIDMAFDKLLGQFADNFSMQVEKLDPVGDEDDDVDNDGDSDDSDDYLKSRRAAIAKAMSGNAKADAEAGERKKTGGNPFKKEDIAAEDDKTPLGEFILSYFDRQTGKFPKGETAVLTSVEKDYGDQYVKPASQFIERLGQAYEQYQQKKLGQVDQVQEFMGVDSKDEVDQNLMKAIQKKFGTKPVGDIRGRTYGAGDVEIDDPAVQMMLDAGILTLNPAALKAYKSISPAKRAEIRRRIDRFQADKAQRTDNPNAQKTDNPNAQKAPGSLFDLLGDSTELDRITSLAGLR